MHLMYMRWYPKFSELVPLSEKITDCQPPSPSHVQSQRFFYSCIFKEPTALISDIVRQIVSLMVTNNDSIQIWECKSVHGLIHKRKNTAGSGHSQIDNFFQKCYS